MTPPRRRYPTDLTDREWALLAPMIPASKPGGRPATHDRRELVNAILYLVRAGCAWRLLPHDLPPWQTVYHYWRAWHRQGLWDACLECCAPRSGPGRAARRLPLTVQPQSTGTVIQVEQRFYRPAVVSNAIVVLYLGGALTGNPFTHFLWTRSPETRLAMWVLSGVLVRLAFRVGTELLRRRDRQDFGYWLSLSVQAPTGPDWRRWRQAS